MLRTKNIQKEEFKDLGLGTRPNDSNQRMVNPDGSFTIERRGVSPFNTNDIYHNLISMSWAKFLVLLTVAYLVINFVFAGIYSMAGLDGLSGINATSGWEGYLKAFFFSAQTITTVGYGGIHPTGYIVTSVAAIESLLGLLAFALATGLLYGRFSRPMAKIMYSEKALIAPYRGISAFEFRILNKRSSQLIEVEAQVVLSRTEIVNGEKKRQFYMLELERSKINYFPSNWTIVHPITPASPFYGSNLQQLKDEDTEVLILLKAFDDTFSQTVYSRSSYTADEIAWGAKFQGMIVYKDNGQMIFDIRKISDYESAELPVMQEAVSS